MKIYKYIVVGVLTVTTVTFFFKALILLASDRLRLKFSTVT